MEELGPIPPPSHSWMAPLVEDMLHDAGTGLTKAVVTGPGWAVLFNLQMEGHVDVPPQSAKDIQELEALDSSPSCYTILVPSLGAAVQLP